MNTPSLGPPLKPDAASNAKKMSDGPEAGCETDRSTDSVSTVVQCVVSADAEDPAQNDDEADVANTCDDMPPYADSLTNAGVSEVEARLREQARAASGSPRALAPIVACACS
jgi:hypothetical protein